MNWCNFPSQTNECRCFYSLPSTCQQTISFIIDVKQWEKLSLNVCPFVCLSICVRSPGWTVWPLTLMFVTGIDLNLGEAGIVGKGRRSKVKVKCKVWFRSHYLRGRHLNSSVANWKNRQPLFDLLRKVIQGHQFLGQFWTARTVHCLTLPGFKSRRKKSLTLNDLPKWVKWRRTKISICHWKF